MQSGVRLVAISLGAMLIAAVTTLALSIVSDRYLTGDILVAPATPQPVVAHVQGAVATPGVYSLPPRARLVDLVEAAGGLRPDANTGQLNLAASIGDGEVVAIPIVQPTANAATPSTDSLAPGSSVEPIDVNSASLPILETLPGIGPVLGQRIIDEREQRGPFTTVDDLVRVDGISDTMVESLRPLVTTGGE